MLYSRTFLLFLAIWSLQFSFPEFTARAESKDLKAGISALENQKFKEAYEILGEIAKNGNTEGQYYFGLLYETVAPYYFHQPDFFEKYQWTCSRNKTPISSFGDDSCWQDAAIWYERAAKGGYVAAQEKIANLYSIGLGVHRDRNRGYFWYKLAAEKGSAISIMVVGVAYLTGDYEKKDVKLGKELIERAIAEGANVGNYWLGYIYENGIGVEIDLQKAFELYLRCAKESESMLAPYRLGQIYENGRGVEKNLVEAVKWYEIARRHGMLTKQTGMLTLRDQMSNEDWIMAFESAEIWLRENK